MTFAEEKRKRVSALLAYIVEKKRATKNSLIGQFCFEWGVRQQRILDYLDELRKAGFIKTYAFEDNPDDFIVEPTKEGIEKVKEIGREKP